ncbi:MAG TPA: 50S ribosomal protein L23 [Armatimonadota bacterium]|nr:50S ribosomal protein L23 [Armatimonadota bacterium]HOS44161.1 50S ribosomal protein L23 [Armatimonadota bacterium]
MTKPIHEILVRPILTEKSVSSAQGKKYTFIVARDATKPEIARAVEALFAKEKVKVAEVNTLNVRGKRRRVQVTRGRRASEGTTPAWKKAIVTLTADSPNIPLLEGA